MSRRIHIRRTQSSAGIGREKPLPMLSLVRLPPTDTIGWADVYRIVEAKETDYLPFDDYKEPSAEEKKAASEKRWVYSLKSLITARTIQAYSHEVIPVDGEFMRFAAGQYRGIAQLLMTECRKKFATKKKVVSEDEWVEAIPELQDEEAVSYEAAMEDTNEEPRRPRRRAVPDEEEEEPQEDRDAVIINSDRDLRGIDSYGNRRRRPRWNGG